MHCCLAQYIASRRNFNYMGIYRALKDINQRKIPWNIHFNSIQFIGFAAIEKSYRIRWIVDASRHERH